MYKLGLHGVLQVPEEHHAEELVEAGETQDLVVLPIPVDALAKFVEGKKFEQLREDGLAVVHGPSFPDRNGHRIQDTREVKSIATNIWLIRMELHHYLVCSPST